MHQDEQEQEERRDGGSVQDDAVERSCLERPFLRVEHRVPQIPHHAGSSNQKVLPRGSRSPTPIVPPCASTASLQKARPRPAAAFICHGEPHPRSGARHRDLDATVGGRVLDRVVDEVLQHAKVILNM